MRLLDHKNTTSNYKRAKELRKEGPLAERLLWNELSKTARAQGLKFRRQYPLHPYIVDFICLKAGLIIEIDSDSHDSRLEYDRKRDVYLRNEGYDILHFGNQEIYANLEGVTAMIVSNASELISRNTTFDTRLRAPSPNPSRKGRGTNLARKGTA